MRKVLLWLCLPICAFGTDPFVLITVPKSGSHLIIKALHWLTGAPPIWHTHFPSFWCIPPEDGFLYTHFCVPEELELNYRSLPKLKQIVLIRDLRDVAVSMVGHIKRSAWPGMSGEMRQHFLSLPFNEQLLFVIEYAYDVHEIADRAPHANQVSLCKLGEQAARYAKDPSKLIIRYEDLVGAQGGGSDEAQLDAVKRMATFIHADSSAVEEIAAHLYGNEYDPFGQGEMQNFASTFSKGEIGAWKEVFQPYHVDAFKAKIGAYLIDLGYEQDNNW